MKLSYHTAVSLTISGILYLAFKSWGMAVGCLISGIFIDLDHVYDYMHEHGPGFSFKKFFQINNNAQYNRIVLFFHGWEWVLVLASASWITDWNSWITGVFIGVSTHIFLDAFSNSSNILSYSLLWRWKKGFHFDTIFSNLISRKYKYKDAPLD